MPIDSVLFRFSGVDTVEQSQSLPLLPVSDALPSPMSEYYFSTEAITGTYPIPGVELMGLGVTLTDWAGVKDLRVQLYVEANHGTGAYRVSADFYSHTGDYLTSWYPSQYITLPAGYSAADTFVVLLHDHAYSDTHLRLRVSPALLQSGYTSYDFYVPVSIRRNDVGYRTHMGGWLSQYSLGHATKYASPIPGMDHFLKLISLRGPAPFSMSLSMSAGGFTLGVDGNGTTFPGATTTNGVKYFTAISANNLSAATVRLDVEAARKTIFLRGYGGTQYTLDDIGYMGDIPASVPVLAGKNILFPQVYKGFTTARGLYVHNISNTEKSVSFIKLASHANLAIYFADLAASSPSAFWLIGDGKTQGVPSIYSTTSISLMSSTAPSLTMTIPAGSMAGVVPLFSYSGASDTESSTSIGVIAT